MGVKTAQANWSLRRSSQLEIGQASREIGQALVENRLSLRRAKKLEERDTRKKLGVIASVFGGKIAQRGLEQLDPTLS
jgi:hypothetical protein